MKILVLSDSHQHEANLEKAVTVAVRSGIFSVIFLGDGYADLSAITARQPITVYAVRGNIDKGIQAEKEKILEIEGYKILLIHGNQIGYTRNSASFLIDKEIDILLYGHTHHQKKEIVKVSGRAIYACNPGTIAKGEYGILEVIPHKVTFDFKKIVT